MVNGIRCFPDYPPSTTVYDPGGLFRSIIRIDDQHTVASKNRPLAYIEYSDHYDSRVEIIDILESVRNDATAIGHPAIVFAIHHWQQLLAWGKYTKDEDIYDDDFNNEIGFALTGKYLKSAKENLKAIGQALLEGVRRQAIPREFAFDLKVEDLQLDETNNFLRAAWKRLHKKYVKETHEPEQRIDTIKQFLTSLPTSNFELFEGDFTKEQKRYGVIDSKINIKTVIDFLKSDGKIFVYDEDSEKSQRCRWKTFRNAFIKWYFDKTSSTLKTYSKTAKKQQIDKNPYTPLTIPYPPKINTFILLDLIFNKSLTEYCEPIECISDKVNSLQFADLIVESKNK